MTDYRTAQYPNLTPNLRIPEDRDFADPQDFGPPVAPRSGWSVAIGVALVFAIIAFAAVYLLDFGRGAGPGVPPAADFPVAEPAAPVATSP